MTICFIEGCERPLHGTHVCKVHWQRADRARTGGPTCRADGCPRPSRAKGLCDAHHLRLRTTGTLGIRPISSFTFWTPEEDDRVRAVLDRIPAGQTAERGTWAELGLSLCRTTGAVQRRACILRRLALAE